MERRVLADSIILDDGFTLEYQKPERFAHYVSVYHGQKYGQYYFRKSPSMILEKTAYIDSGYLIKQHNKIIGGLLLKPNFMSDLFIVPPFEDYALLAKIIIAYLKVISTNGDKIVIQHVIEEHLDIFKDMGFKIETSEYWMTRPTEALNTQLPEGYTSRLIVEEDINEIADLIIAAYRNNPCYPEVGTRGDYSSHVDSFLKNKDQDILYKSSQVVVDNNSNRIVGSCLNLLFEELPLIDSLVVCPQHQGKGLGGYLLKHSISHTHKDFKATRLIVMRDNQAIGLYEHHGFIKHRPVYDLYINND